MKSLKIQLFGPFSIVASSEALECATTRKAKALLAYLILAKSRPVCREIIATAFWGNLPETQARRALNTDFWRLRQVLTKAGIDPACYFESGNDCIRFSSESCFVDVLEFASCLQQATQRSPEHVGDKDLSEISAAVALYRGEFLEGAYDEWSLQQREHFRARYQIALDFQLRGHLALGRFDEAIRIGEELLGFDPIQESVHRTLMRCYAALGDRPRAIRQYRTCCEALGDYLGIIPMPETQRLYDELVGKAASASDTETLARTTLAQWRDAVDHVASAQRSLTQLGIALKNHPSDP